MSVIDDYLKNVEPLKRAELERIRKAIKHAAPEAEEVISYGMPVFKFKGKYLIGFSGFKNHMSIFPGPEAIGACKDKLHEFKVSKGTIQFTSEAPISNSLIEEIVKVRLNRIKTS